MDLIKGVTDVDGLAWDNPVQKYCKLCDFAPITSLDYCIKCGGELKVIER